MSHARPPQSADDLPTSDPIRLALNRNVPIELQFRAQDGELIVLKSRILGIDETGRLELDMPQSIGHEIDFRFGLVFDGHFAIGEKRYTFRSRIRDLMHRIELNASKRLVGIVVDYPTDVIPGQRRNDHRVIIDQPPISARACPAINQDGIYVCPLDSRPMSLRVANLSTGGCAIIFDNEDGKRIRINDLFFMELFLPGEREQILCLLEVRQTKELPRGGGYRIGAKLKMWPDPTSIRRWQQTVQHYLTKVQRERLQRRSA